MSDTWHALTAPPKTPDDIVAKLNAAANKAMTDPDLLARYKQLSISPGGGTPAEAAAFIKSETRALERSDPRRRHQAGMTA